MKLEPSSRDATHNKLFVVRTRSAFQELLYIIKNARVRKDGTFYKTDKNRIYSKIYSEYIPLTWRFDIENEIIDDEITTAQRLLDTLTAKQFIAFAEVAFEPYINLEEV